MEKIVVLPVDDLQRLIIDCVNACLKHHKPQLADEAPTAKAERPLTVDEAATFLQLSTHTIYSLVSRREIPSMKRGNRLYFSKADLTDWIEGGRKKTNAELTAEATTHRKRRA